MKHFAQHLNDEAKKLQDLIDSDPMQMLGKPKNYEEEHDCKNSPEDGCEVCCEKYSECEFCGDTGETTEQIWDEDSGNYQPTGNKKCNHFLTL